MWTAVSNSEASFQCPWWGHNVTGATECTLDGVGANAARCPGMSMCCGEFYGYCLVLLLQRAASARAMHLWGPKSMEHVVNHQRAEQ